MANENPNIQQTATGFDVYPTGAFRLDSDNVQSAVDMVANGGTVVLKAVNRQGQPMYFHFGDDAVAQNRGSVKVKHDVVVCGEATPPRLYPFPGGRAPEAGFTPDRTVIYGGWRPLACPPTNATAPALTVRQIFFAYPAYGAVFAKKCSGIEVSDCVVYDASAADTNLAGNPRVSIGIEVTGLNLDAPILTGDCKFFRNRVKRAEELAYSRLDSGIVVQNSDMQIDIRDNTVVGFALAGIAVDENRADATIQNNVVTSCGYGTLPVSAGIGVCRNASSGPGRSTKVTVRDNTITGGSVAGPGGSRLSSKNGITLWGATGITVKSNTITGSVRSDGILVTNYVQPDKTTASRNNLIQANTMSQLVAGHAQELFDTACDGNRSNANDLGAVDLTGSGVAGIVVHSNDNEITNDTFWGTFPGTTGIPDVPCVWLVADTQGNRVTALKCAQGLPAFDLCTQIQNDDPRNDIPGYNRCAHVNLADILQREEQHCLREGGVWSAASHSCALGATP